jgi:hypothetical protein
MNKNIQRGLVLVGALAGATGAMAAGTSPDMTQLTCCRLRHSDDCHSVDSWLAGDRLCCCKRCSYRLIDAAWLIRN